MNNGGILIVRGTIFKGNSDEVSMFALNCFSFRIAFIKIVEKKLIYHILFHQGSISVINNGSLSLSRSFFSVGEKLDSPEFVRCICHRCDFG